MLYMSQPQISLPISLYLSLYLYLFYLYLFYLYLSCSSYKEKEGLAPAVYLSRYSGPQLVGASPTELVESVRDAVQLASGTRVSGRPSARIDIQEREWCVCVCMILISNTHSNLCSNAEKGICESEHCCGIPVLNRC